jgi:hypothetical protein
MNMEEVQTAPDDDMPNATSQPVPAPAAAPDASDTVGPVLLAIITLVAGPLISGPMAGRTLHRLGYRVWAWIVGVGLGLAGMGLDIGILLWRAEHYWATLTLLLVHGVCAGALLLGLGLLFKRRQCELRTATDRRGSYRQIIAGMLAGAFGSGLLGVAMVSLYILLSDRLMSTFMPVAFEDAATLVMLAMALFPMLAAGLVAGGLLGWLRPRTGPVQMLGYALALIWAQLTWLAALQVTIGIPGFQAGAATHQGWEAVLVPFTLGQLLVGIGWSLALLFYTIRPRVLSRQWRRAMWVPAINLGAAVALAIVMGYPADLFLALGRHQEREAHVSKALWCYQLGLSKSPAPRIASYLQYRAALIQHKLGHEDMARDGFRRVVTKYNRQYALAKKAARFLDNLQKGAAGRRVVLPGVETRTQYTGAYCVPNSLALAMRYWGAPVDARRIGARITGLGTGTYVVDQSWYAQQLGFHHDFLPLAGLEDIKACIDAGFPVLVYVPQHVFAIVGYDEALKTFVTYDVATRDIWVEYLQDDFVKAWKKQATTLVLAYPEKKADRIPASIRSRLKNGSDSYLHFQLHYFDTLTGPPAVAHLEKAAGEDADFFFPLMILYDQFPSLRKTLDARYDADRMTKDIIAYFGQNFDEGVHEAGQQDDEDWSDPDWALKASVKYLIGHGRFTQIEQLLARVDAQGRLSNGMRFYNAMIALSQGRYEDSLDRFGQSSGAKQEFYGALAALQTGNRARALQGLTETIEGCL